MKRWDRGARLYLRFGIALGVAAVFLFPIYWLAAISVKNSADIFASPPVFIPSQIDFNSYESIINDGDIVSIYNSLIVAGVSTVIAMALGTLAAYSIVRFRTGGENLEMWIISQRMIPPIAIAFPVFLVFVGWGLVDTMVGLIMLYTAFNMSYVIWMMRAYLLEIPIDIEHSALVDGCSRWQVLWMIVLPMVRGGLFATAVFTFVFAWNEFLFALILTNSEVITFPVRVTGYFGSQSTFWQKIGAMSMLGMLPMMVIVATMQRWIVRGMSFGAVKG